MKVEDVELVGGVHCGRVMAVKVGVERVHVPRPVSLRAEPEAAVPDPPWEDVYRRDVISDRTHRWRYVLERRQP